VSDLVQCVEVPLQAKRLLKRRQSLLVAVSGGLDSMVLLEVLRQLGTRYGWRLTIAHLNHRLRGASSNADERLVRATAKSLGLPCVVGQVDVRSLAERQQLSIEMAARQSRHEFLARVARSRGIRTIALAHHADDQVELFFLRLLRGAGRQGLAGMEWSGASPVDPRLTLIRPLLGCRRAGLMEFARAEKIRFREDASNTALNILRNRVRHDLLPLLARDYQPALVPVILRNMEILGAEDELLDQLAEDWRGGKSSVVFTQLSQALQRRVVQRGVLELGVTPEFDLVETLRAGPNRTVVVPGGTAVRHDGQGRIHRVEETSICFDKGSFGLSLVGPQGEGFFDGLSWRWQIQKSRGGLLPVFASGCEWFDADKVGASAGLRHWRAGDRFQPSGMKSSVKLQDLFANLKVPRPVRHRLVVATTATDEIWWVEGLRIGERFKLGPGTKRRLKWTWQRVQG
jgi:tRNA(Ile)-lysidine synthase